MRRLIGVGFGAALILANACGGAQPSGTGQAGSQPAATGTAPATAAARATPTPAGPNLLDVLKAGNLATYKVSYRWSIVAGGQTIDSTQTWYYKPPKARFDYSLAGPGGPSFSVFVLEDGTYVCTNAGGTSFCQRSSQQAALQQNVAADFDLQISGRPDQFNSTYQGARTITGQSAQCWGVKSVAASSFGDVTSCYSATGVPLLMQIKAPGTDLTMEATSFSTTVADADFTLPGPVR